MRGSKKPVVRNEALAIRVGKFLLGDDFDYCPADEATGYSLGCSLFASDHLAILGPQPVGKSKTPRRKRRRYEPRRKFLGVIWFQSRAMGANPKNWVLAAHGRKQHQEHMVLAELLEEAFKVNVEVVLVREHAAEEGFPSDNYAGMM